MWNLFRRKRKSGRGGPSQAAAQPSDRVQELANTLQREGRTKELELQLTKLDQQSLSADELESWWHLYGITAFQDGREAEALARFQKGYEQFPASALIRFSLGQQYIRTGAVEEGFALFRACKFPEIPREYALAQARYAYLWNRYRKSCWRWRCCQSRISPGSRTFARWPWRKSPAGSETRLVRTSMSKRF